MKVIFATGNKSKLREINEILKDTGIEAVSMSDAGVNIDINEDGTSFEENAIIKAKAVWEKTGGIVLGDDSGMCVDYLGGEPGIYSARYMGEDTSYIIKNAAIIDRLKDAKDDERGAHFETDIAAVFPDGSIKVTRGIMKGTIAKEPKGENGFGFDPIFYVPELGKTNAELTLAEKTDISHRGKALRAMKEILKEYAGK